jgi:hypothetical protein
MGTRSIDAKRTAYPTIGLAAAAMLAVALATSGAVKAQERGAGVQPSAVTLVAAVRPIDPTYVGPGRASGKALESPGDVMPQSSAGASQPTNSTVDQAINSVTVSAAVRQSDPWDGFRNSVASAATPSCFGPDALPHEELATEGLLRLPFLAHAAATSACR